MPQAEGVMSRENSERLRDLLYPGAQTLFGFPIVEYGDPLSEGAIQQAPSRPKADPTSEHVLTKRKIPIIGSDKTVEVWLKG